MSKEMAVIVLGFWVIIVPYTGLPSSWRTVLLLLAGIVIVVLGFLLRGKAFSRPSRKTEHHPYAESTGRMSDMRTVEPTEDPQQ